MLHEEEPTRHAACVFLTTNPARKCLSQTLERWSDATGGDFLWRVYGTKGYQGKAERNHALLGTDI
jgi:hypothetical protein